MILFFAFIVPFLAGIIITPLLISISEKTGKVVDIATGDILKIHQKPISLFGGVGIAVSLFLGFLLFTETNPFFSRILTIFLCGNG